MRKLITLSTTLVLALGISGVAFASPNTKRADRREVKQQARIIQGVKSGELTRKEALRLERGQARVHRAEAIAKADGNVTAKEKQRLERKQDKQSRRIHRQAITVAR